MQAFTQARMLLAKNLPKLAREHMSIDEKNKAGRGGRILQSVPSFICQEQMIAVYAKEVCFGTVFHLKHRADTSSFRKTIKSLQN